MAVFAVTPIEGTFAVKLGENTEKAVVAASEAQGFRDEAVAARDGAAESLAAIIPAGATQLAAIETEGTEQAALVTAAGGVFTTLTKEARDGGALGQTAIDALSVLTKVSAPSNATATWARWSKAFDAGAVNDDFTVVAGSIVAGVTVQGAVLGLTQAATVRGRVWRRSLSSGSLNAAPGAAGDVVIADSGAVPPPADWPLMQGLLGHATVILPVPEFEAVSGFTYLVDIEWRDGSSALLATRIGYKQLGSAVAQRYAGFYYASTGASSWTNHNTQRPFGLGLATRVLKNITTIETLARKGGLVPAAAEASLLTPMERQMIEEGGAWDKVKRPGTDTTGNGLALLFGDSTWTPGVGRGQYGVDFGPTTPLGSLTDGTTLPGYMVGPPARILLNASSIVDTIGGRSLQGFFLNGAYVDLTTAFPQNLTVRNFDIRNGGSIGISQLTGTGQFLTVEDGYIEGNTNRNILIYNGVIRRCMFDLARNDNIGIGGSNDTAGLGWAVTIEQSLFRRPGAASFGVPDAHGDCFQSTSAKNVSITGSTFYFPANGTTYDEGVVGATNALRFESGPSSNTTSPVAHSRGVLVAGNLIVGGTYAIGMALEGQNQYFENYCLLGNRYAPVSGYAITGHLIFYARRAGDTNSYVKNFCFFDEYQTNGLPISIGVASNPGAGWTAYASRTETTWKAIAGNPTPYRPYEEKWGIFDFDRSRLDARTIEILQRYGKATGREILRWNNTVNPAYDLGALRS